MWIGKMVLALAVAVAAACLLVKQTPRAAQGVDLSPPESTKALAEALRANMISPYRWLELAEGYEQAGDFGKARFCLEEAEKNGPNLPPVWIRAAAFDFRAGRKEDALRMGVRAQAISPDADEFLFQYYDAFVRNTGLVIQTLDGDVRALTAYLNHMMAKGRPADAGLIWDRLGQLGPVDRQATLAYVEFLLKQRRYQEARTIWFQQNGSQSPNRVFNGGFEQEPSTGRLDWQLSKIEGMEPDRDDGVARQGKFSLRVRFDGEHNLDFTGAMQTVVVEPGEYRFAAWLKTDGVTTDQGVRFCLFDAEARNRLDVETEAFAGTHDWMEVRKSIAIPPGTNLVNIGLCRHPSLKFDNKIAGTVWVDDVSLTR